MPNYAELYDYAKLASAAYVDLGTTNWNDGQNVATTAARVNEKGEGIVPSGLADVLFNPDNKYQTPVWTVLDGQPKGSESFDFLSI